VISKYLEAEKRLAQLRGYKEIFRLKVDGVEHGGLHYNKSTFTGAEKVPRWCREWEACGPLMVEYGCYPTENGTGSVIVLGPKHQGCIYSDLISNHPDKETAVRYVIVMAVIAILERVANT
jgi:hypothetical protein